MGGVMRFWERLREVLDVQVVELGGATFTLWAFVQLLVLIPLLFIVTALIRRWVIHALASGNRLDQGLREAVGSILRYAIIALGLLIIIQTAGVDLTTLNVLAGALGIGLGFGLQNVASNFISGLIIMFERPIKLGDRIVVSDVEGDVVAINARSTTVVTNDNIAIIVPNSRFVTETVVNWSHSDENVRLKIPVSVAYGTDVRSVEKVLLEVAQENEDVLESPPPVVRFMGFGDSGLHLELRAWTQSLTRRKAILISALNFAIYDAFKKHGIEIPFPQRDLHVKTGRLAVEVEGGG
jgi:small-conductance mechanosensitive channel